MDFAHAWVDIVMKCVLTIYYSIILNERMEASFHPSIGLQQEDPLSLFFFLIRSEGLSTLMRLIVNEGHLKGVKTIQSGPQISHLLFADDCVLFGEAIMRGVMVLKRILKEYEVNSGWCVNFDKSMIFFSVNKIESMRMQISTELGMRYSNNLEKHLGLLNSVCRKKKASFQHLKDRMKQKK